MYTGGDDMSRNETGGRDEAEAGTTVDRTGAGAVGLFGSVLMIIGPGSGAPGGFKYLIAISWQYSTFLHDFLLIISGQLSSLIGYS